MLNTDTRSLIDPLETVNGSRFGAFRIGDLMIGGSESLWPSSGSGASERYGEWSLATNVARRTRFAAFDMEVKLSVAAERYWQKYDAENDDDSIDVARLVERYNEMIFGKEMAEISEFMQQQEKPRLNQEVDELLDAFLVQEEEARSVSRREWLDRLGRDLARGED